MSNLTDRHVVVVGAGIIGAMLGWQLVKRGARVSIIEALEPGGVATPCSFGWVNATHGNPKPYFDLRMASMALWRELKAKNPSLSYEQTGTVYLHLDDHDGVAVDLKCFAASHQEWGYRIEEVGGNALRTKAPHIKALPADGLWAPDEGAAEGATIAKSLIEECVANGATVMTGLPVERLLVRDNRVVGLETRLGPIETDEVIIAAGVGTTSLIPDIAPPIPLKAPPGILVHTHPCEPIIPHITLTRDLHIRQLADRSILAGWDFGGGAGPEDPQKAAEGILERIRNTFEGAQDIELARVTVGLRPTPADGFPVVGRPGGIPGMMVAVMHSGVTLAPFVGQEISRFLESGDMHPLLRPFDPARFVDTQSV